MRILNKFTVLYLTLIICAFSQIVRAEDYVLITSATSELGNAVSEALAMGGKNLILAGRNAENLKSLKIELEEKYGVKHHTFTFDYTDLSSIHKIRELLENKELSGMVVISPKAVVLNGDIPNAEEWEKSFRLCFSGPMEFIKTARSKLGAESSIVIISGVTSTYLMHDHLNSNVFKIIWSAEIKNLAHQFKKQKIRVNAVSPGTTLTDFNIHKIKERALKNQKSFEAQLEIEAASTPLHRFAEPEDVANSVEFLLSDKARHINGVNLIVDGGLSHSY